MGTKNLLTVKNNVGKKLHPTEKPTELLEVLISNSADLDKEHVVLDMFVGCGSTAVACKELGVGCIGIEIDKKYFDVGISRLSENV